jgi:RNA polymerase sigma factor (sigma-70 family)
MEDLMRQHADSHTFGQADEDIVEQFLGGNEINSDDAFRLLVERHGPMVLGVCRQILDQEADAEDAFQATFLILSRKVASVRNRAILGAWLYEVAYRTAVKTRAKTIRRRSVERQSVSMLPSQFVPDRQHHDAAWAELRPILHDEVRQLPEKYRVPIILSYLQGKTNEEVAQLLDWPVGTVKGRLHRARELLRTRLMRRGTALGAAFLLSALADGTVFAEVVSQELGERTVQFVQQFKAASALPGSTSSPDQFSTDATFPKRVGAMIDALRRTPRFLGFPLVVVIAVLSISAVVGIGVALGRSGGRSHHLPSAVSTFLSTQIGASSCH